jgi:hypothetical protein
MMRMQYWGTISRSVGRVVLMTLFGIVMWGISAQAAITLQSFTEPVEVQFQGSSWTSISESVELTAGDVIATGKGGMAELLFEDGSTVVLEQETQLAIRDLEFSEAEEVRVSRLKLLWGKIMGKATPLAYKTNVFEVETNTALAGFKFSSMTIASTSEETIIIPLDGALEFQQITGTTQIIHTSDTGVVTTYTLPPDAQVEMQITPGEPVQITSNVALPNVQVTTTDSTGNQATAVMTIPQDATVGIERGDTEGDLLSISSTVELPDVHVQTTSSDGDTVDVTLTVPGTTRIGEPGEVNIGVTNEGQLSLKGNTEIPEVRVQTTSNGNSVTTTFSVPAAGEVTIGEDPDTGTTTIGSDVELDAAIGDNQVIIGADAEIDVTATDTGADIDVNSGTAVVNDQFVLPGQTAPVQTEPTEPSEPPEAFSPTKEVPNIPPAPLEHPADPVASPILP